MNDWPRTFRVIGRACEFLALVFALAMVAGLVGGCTTLNKPIDLDDIGPFLPSGSVEVDSEKDVWLISARWEYQW